MNHLARPRIESIVPRDEYSNEKRKEALDFYQVASHTKKGPAIGRQPFSRASEAQRKQTDSSRIPKYRRTARKLPLWLSRVFSRTARTHFMAGVTMAAAEYVVGGGTSGLMVANHLSEDHKVPGSSA